MDKNVLLASMSHEIRTPMNNIIGFAELATEQSMPAEIRSYLDKILENSHEILEIINDISDINIIDTGKIELEDIPFDIADIIEQCHSEIMPKASVKNNNVDFFIEPSPDGRLLMGDPKRIHQIIYNVILNAVKFTESGNIKVSSAITNTSERNQTIYFQVTDNGIGMTKEQISQICDPFDQEDTSMARKYGGMGLGMTVVKKLLEIMDSRILIESTQGEGTKVSFELNFEIAAENDSTAKFNADSQQEVTIARPRFKGNVLVCEDNEMNQMVINEHLERVGLDVEIVENGQLGVNKVRERVLSGNKPYDLIMMDIHMPVMDGLEATKKINDFATATPIIAMTANVMSDDRELYKRLGMLDCVDKPFTSQELWRCLLKYFEPIAESPRDRG